MIDAGVGSDGTQYPLGKIVRATRISIDGIHLWTLSGKDSVLPQNRLRAIISEEAAQRLLEAQSASKLKDLAEVRSVPRGR